MQQRKHTQISNPLSLIILLYLAMQQRKHGGNVQRATVEDDNTVMDNMVRRCTLQRQRVAAGGISANCVCVNIPWEILTVSSSKC